MTARLTPHDTGFGIGILASTVIHLAVFLLLYWYAGRHPAITVQETYYVDVVNLPVAAPQAGSSSVKPGGESAAPPAPQPPEAPQLLPAPRTPAAAPKVPAPGARTGEPAARPQPRPQPQPQPPVENGDEALAERMAQLERQNEARRQEAALARLKERVRAQGSGKPGVPAGSGTEAGSDYSAYLKSRLEDALEKTSSYTSRAPEMVVRLFIDADGRLSRRKAERSSGDRAFEISVMRAIDVASEKFPPPPNRRNFEGVFVFRPKGVMSGK